MTAPYSKEQYIRITKAIAFLIKKRDSALPTDDVKTEALNLAHCILQQAMCVEFSEVLKTERRNTSSPYEEFSALKTSIESAMCKAKSLSESSQIHFYFLNIAEESDQSNGDIDRYGRLLSMLDECNEIIEKASVSLSPQGKGKPKNISKEAFVETVMQVFEQALGITFEDIKTLPIKEHRLIKTSFFELLDASTFYKLLSQSPEALRKVSNRYVKSGRNQREDVEYILNEMLRS